MRFIKRFNESDFDDEVISHLSFLKDMGYIIMKPYVGRYLIHKLDTNSENGSYFSHFKLGEIKDDIMPIFQLFNVESIQISSYYEEEFETPKWLTIEQFDAWLDDSLQINKLLFDIG